MHTNLDTNTSEMPSKTIPDNGKVIYAAIIAIIAWFALILQFYIGSGSTINFFSYFTVLCNLLIAISLTFISINPSMGSSAFFSRLSVQTAIALYIFIVALVYNLVLRGIVELSGWSFIADSLLHVLIPVFYILYWIIYRPKGTIEWKDGLLWALFPLIYLIYSLVRGSFVNWYPYPFLNVIKFGYVQVAINVSLIICVFVVAGMALIAAARAREK